MRSAPRGSTSRPHGAGPGGAPHASAQRSLAILGSTGSIGEQTLAVAERECARLRVVALAAGRSLERLCEQAARWQPQHLAPEQAEDPAAAREQLRAAAPGAEVEVGRSGSCYQHAAWHV